MLEWLMIHKSLTLDFAPVSYEASRALSSSRSFIDTGLVVFPSENQSECGCCLLSCPCYLPVLCIFSLIIQNHNWVTCKLLFSELSLQGFVLLDFFPSLTEYLGFKKKIVISITKTLTVDSEGTP